MTNLVLHQDGAGDRAYARALCLRHTLEFQIWARRAWHTTWGIAVALLSLSVSAQSPQTSLAPKPRIAPAETLEVAPLVEDEQTANLAFLESQIKTGEADEALGLLNQQIRTLEQTYHRYHEDLLTPIMLRGDAYVELEQYDAALEEFGRARHIARVNHGLFDAKQIPAIYRQAEVLREVGNVIEAGRREEYAYEVARRVYPEYAAELLPPMTRLADFYMESNNPLAARTLLNRARLIHEHQESTQTDEAIEVLRAIAKSHRLERFPPFYIDRSDQEEAEEVFSAQLRNSDLRDQFRYINSFPAGEQALQEVVAIQQQRFGENSPAALEALLALADWHLMFAKTHSAHTLYEHIYLTLEGDVDSTSGQGSGKGVQMFAEPVLLHFPKPPNPKPPNLSERGALNQGFVSLEFGIAPSGGVRQLKTLDIEGPKNMNFRVRRSMRQAIFRPRVETGTVVGSENQTFRYQYTYYEKLEEEDASSNATEAEDA